MSDKERKIAVVTDSAAALSPELIAQHELHVARMEITIDGSTFLDDGNPALEGFYARRKASESVPTTSAPVPEEYLEKMNLAAEKSDDVLCITVSARLSAAYDSAVVAAEMFNGENPGKSARVLDSQLAASSQALIVLEAARAAALGLDIDTVEGAAREVAEKVRLVAMLDTLKYIHRSGRVPKIAVWATDLLNIKPVMEFSVEKIGALARPRSTERALNRIRTEMERDLSGRKAHVNIIHAGASENAEFLREWAVRNLDATELFVSQFHPFMGAHTGPGLVGASWWAE